MFLSVGNRLPTFFTVALRQYNTRSFSCKCLPHSESTRCLKFVFHMTQETLRQPNIIISRHMAGHAKWQNVKHIKAEKDRQKNFLCNKYARLVAMAIRDKGPDPKLNRKLATLIEEAKRNNVPSSTIENALKKDNKKMKSGNIEILGPGGCFIIIEYETDNISITRHDIKVLCKKYSANVLSGDGRWRAVYEQKGIIKATCQLNGQLFDAEKALDAAIEAGAEDVQKKEEAEENSFLEFSCAPDDLHAVKKELEKQYEIEEAYIAFIPTTSIELNKDDLTLTDNLLSELEEMQDVIRIYENVQQYIDK